MSLRSPGQYISGPKQAKPEQEFLKRDRMRSYKASHKILFFSNLIKSV